MLVVENGRNPEGGTIKTPFRSPRNPHGATDDRLTERATELPHSLRCVQSFLDKK